MSDTETAKTGTRNMVRRTSPPAGKARKGEIPLTVSPPVKVQDDEVLVAMKAAYLNTGEPRSDFTSDLVSEKDILGRAPMSYLIEPFIPRGMASVIFGAPGSGKTFVGHDMGSSIRAGIPWQGHPVSRGAVLLLEAEGLEQLQTRIVAWNDYHREVEGPAAFRALEESLNASSPEGCAALIRTVWGMEASIGEKVELIWMDPAALYMAGSENEDGNRNLIIGLNAVAKFLNIGVLLIVHTNAVGDRARGTDHLRMLSGSYIRVEKLSGDRIGIVQEKIKNTAARAVILRPIPIADSLVLTTEQRLDASDYENRKSSASNHQRATEQSAAKGAAHDVKSEDAERFLLEYIAGNPGQNAGGVVNGCMSRGVGKTILESARKSLISKQLVRVEIQGHGNKAPQLHYIA